MRALHATPHASPAHGGPSVSVPALLRALLPLDVDAELVTLAWPGDEGPLPAEPFRRTVLPARTVFGWSPKLAAVMRRGAREAAVVHSHNLWLYLHMAAFRAARAERRPHVVSPRGALEPWALERSRPRKAVVGALFQTAALRTAACIHVLTPSEGRNVRKLFPRVPIAAIPNGIDLASFADLPAKTAFAARFPELAGRRLLLFMARLHPKKGTVHLLDAWARVAPDHPDWHLVMAGPDELGARAALERQAAERGAAARVTFTGLLTGLAKREALAAADAFLLPSFSEGFSMAVLEALASGLPALLTPGCNFPEAAAAGACIEEPPTVEGTERGLRALLERSDAQRAAMGAAGRRLVAERYGWDAIARSMRDVYAWCIGGGTRPDSMRWEE